MGRMSGPFTKSELRAHFWNQHFQTAPLGVVPKAGEPGSFRIIRDASFRGDAPCSVNDQIDPDEQTTRWGKALDMAEVVSEASLRPLCPGHHATVPLGLASLVPHRLPFVLRCEHPGGGRRRIIAPSWVTRQPSLVQSGAANTQAVRMRVSYPRLGVVRVLVFSWMSSVEGTRRRGSSPRSKAFGASARLSSRA